MQNIKAALSALNAFGVTVEKITRLQEAMLSEVYIVNDNFILRGRPLEPKSIEHYTNEQNLIAIVRKSLPFLLPTNELTSKDESYVLGETTFWTLYRKLSGKPLGHWFELHQASDESFKIVLATLRRLHDCTKGLIPTQHITVNAILQKFFLARSSLKAFLSLSTLQVADRALKKLADYADTLTQADMVLVHGDFHHGNVLVDDALQVTGIIDLNWIRGGAPFDDLGYTLMMLLRDYQTWNATFNKVRFTEFCSYYGVPLDQMDLLLCYLFMHSLDEYCILQQMTDTTRKQEYQLSYSASIGAFIAERF